MSTTIDTFIYLKRDIEQSFQRVQTLSNSPHYHHQEFEQILNHISCTLDDLEKVNQLLQSSSTHQLDLSNNNNDDDDDEKAKLFSEKCLTVGYSKENESSLFSSNSNVTIPSADQREEFLHYMKNQYDYYKNKISLNKNKPDSQMEVIQLDQENEDQIIRRQDEQLEDFHLSIVSLKNLTANINTEINDHIRVLDNLETNMIDNQNRVENLTKRTKNFLRTSNDGVGGHTYLFCIAIILFFLIIILILFF